MKKIVVTVLLVNILFIASCATLDSMFLPKEDGSPSDTMNTVNDVNNAAVAVGGPYAIPVLAVTNLISIIAGVYTNARKKQLITKKDDVAEQTTIVVEAIVKAIEDSDTVVIDDNGTTVKDVIKEKVTDKLQKQGAYKIGKAIIDAIKDKI